MAVCAHELLGQIDARSSEKDQRPPSHYLNRAHGNPKLEESDPQLSQYTRTYHTQLV
jgi:hypothetical protein